MPSSPAYMTSSSNIDTPFSYIRIAANEGMDEGAPWRGSGLHLPLSSFLQRKLGTSERSFSALRHLKSYLCARRCCRNVWTIWCCPQEKNIRSRHASSVDRIHWRVLLDVLVGIGIFLVWYGMVWCLFIQNQCTLCTAQITQDAEREMHEV